MLRIIQDLWHLGVETYDSLEESLHRTLTGEKSMKIKIINKCKTGSFRIKYFDQQLGCWLEGYESEANLRQGISEGVFVVDNAEQSNTTTVEDTSILAQARANAASNK